MKKVLLSLALSFSLSFAFTAADVYGVWNASGKLETTINNYLGKAVEGQFLMMVISGTAAAISIPKGSDFSSGDDHFRFSKDDFNDKWRFNQGKITFPSSYMQCQLISSKVMDCDVPAGYGFRKQTLKKAGTIAQFEAQLKKDLEKAKKEAEKKMQEKEKQKLEQEKQRQEEEKQAEVSRKEFSYETFNFGGEDYPTIKVGNTVWMAKNLNLPAEKSVCYKNEPENCEKYGRLYNWETAIKACPKGWHLPSGKEWQALIDFVDDEYYTTDKLKATSGWNSNGSGNGTDKYGFSALPGGYGKSDGSFNDVGWCTLWWSASENEDLSDNYFQCLYYVLSYVGRDNSYPSRSDDFKSYLFSVRCVQD
jgi:uncharacterized protein (TIGR02145 family)